MESYRLTTAEIEESRVRFPHEVADGRVNVELCAVGEGAIRISHCATVLKASDVRIELGVGTSKHVEHTERQTSLPRARVRRELEY